MQNLPAGAASDSRAPFNEIEREAEGELSVLTVETWFSRGQRSEMIDVEHEWREVCGGIDIYVSEPDWSEYIVKPDDFKEDFSCSLREHYTEVILKIHWL
jgi:hypothetical protein